MVGNLGLWPDGPFNQGLVGEWRFDYDTGLLLPDYSGYGHSGIIIGAAWTETDAGPALLFDDAASDYVNLGTQPGLEVNGHLTIEAYVEIDAADVEPWIVANHGEGAADCHYGVLLGSSDKFNFRHGTELLASNGTLTVGQAHHLVATRTGSSGAWTFTLYLDGAYDNSAAKTGNPAANAQCTIGRRGARSQAYFSGYIYFVRIYDCSLTAEEVAARYGVVKSRATGAKNFWMVPFIVEEAVVTHAITVAIYSVLKESASAVSVVYAALKGIVTTSAAARAAIKETAPFTAVACAALKETVSATVAKYAVLKESAKQTIAAQATLKEAVSVIAHFHAVLKEVTSVTVNAYAVLKESVGQSAATKAVIGMASSVSAAVMAYLEGRAIFAPALFAIIKGAGETTAALHAYLESGAVTADMIAPSRWTTMDAPSRSFTATLGKRNA